MTTAEIPTINAVLNGCATILITAGLVCIRTGRRVAHRACMLAAAFASGLFLVGYVAHKILVRGVHTPFAGPELLRPAYLVLLASHVILAMAIAGAVPRTFWLALSGRYERHRAWARWTFPVWLYVSATGVLVYLCLYVWWPSAAA
ncbi:MAG: DUF420 domain-containing protein [Opitutaceae bacterium]